MQQHDSKYFACSHPLPSEGQNSTFSEHGHAAHQRYRKCSNMVATADRGTINMKHINCDFGSKTCAGPPGWTCQNSIFLEHGHVAYQIKGNHCCSNMVENILAGNPLPPPLTLGVKRSKLNFYRILSYQIK